MKVVLREWLHEKHALFLMIISLILSISVAIIFAKIITDISSLFNNPQNFNSMILVILILLILQVAFISMNEYLRKKSIILAYNHMASRYYDKILNAEYEMFTKFSVSKIYTVSNAMKDITAIAEQSTLAITYIVNIIVVLTTIWTISHSLIIPILIIYIIGTIIMRLIFNKYRKYDEAVKNSTIKRNQELENIINGFAEVRVFNNKDWHRVRIKEYLNDTYISRIARNKLNIVLHGSIETIESLGIIFVIIYAIYQLRNGSIDAATAMSLVLFIMKLINPILGLLSFIDSLSEYLALIDDYDHIINFKNQNNRGNLELGNFNDEITLNNISFSYDNTTNAVNNLSMTIKKGQRIGICGYSGGGKSTLFKLINKFYYR